MFCTMRRSIPSALMFAALNEQDFLCRVFGRCLAGDPLDREVGDMIGKNEDLYSPNSLPYLRYNAELTRAGLNELGLAERGAHARATTGFGGVCRGSAKSRKAVAERKVKAEHFADFLNVVRQSQSHLAGNSNGACRKSCN